MARLSVCMIVKDEAARLSACLESLGDLAAEIIVCDTGSTDETVAIATHHGAQVYSIGWPDDFAAARNQSLAKATQDWILVIDADETLTEAGQAQIRSILADDPVGDIPIAQLLLVTWLRQEMGAQQSPYTQVSRLFRNHLSLTFNRPYHETIDDSADALTQAEPQWQVAQLDTVALTHTGYADEAIQAQNKFERAQRLMARHLDAHPRDAYLCNKLGALHGAQGNWTKGLTLIERGLACDSDPVTQYELHYHAGLANRQLNRPQQAQKHYQAALAVPIDERLKLGTYLNLGSLYKHQGALKTAIALFERAVQLDPTQARAHYNLGVAHRANGYLEPALAAYQQAIQRDPNYAEAYQNMGAVLFKLGRLPESRTAFQTAIQLYKANNPAEAIRLQQGLFRLGLG